MPGNASDDEFDDLSDPFEGVDWSTIPELATPESPSEPCPQQQQEEETTQPDTTICAENNNELAPERSPSERSDYFDDDFDASMLAEVDFLERRAMAPSTNKDSNLVTGQQAQAVHLGTGRHNSSRQESGQSANEEPAATTSDNPFVSRFFHAPPGLLVASTSDATCVRKGEPTTHKRPRAEPEPSLQKISTNSHAANSERLPSSPRKRAKIDSSPVISSKSSGKGKANPNDDVRHVLEAFEDELTCPICCDLFVAAHLGNPCGHCYCGECGWAWTSKNKRSPICALCRGVLSVDAPMIPNFALDGMVDRHIKALADNGDKGWQAGGSKLIERCARKENWKRDAAKRTGKPKSSTSRRPQHRAPVIDVDDDWLVPDDEEDGSYHDDGSSEVQELDDFDIENAVREAISRALSAGSIQNENAGEGGRTRNGGSRHRNGASSGGQVNGRIPTARRRRSGTGN